MELDASHRKSWVGRNLANQGLMIALYVFFGARAELEPLKTGARTKTEPSKTGARDVSQHGL